MKHPNSRLLHAYWDRLRGERAAPDRSEIEPGAIRHLLADSLILELDPARRAAHLRLAGTRVCALFGRELRGTAFADLWEGAESGAIRDARRRNEAWDPLEIVTGDTMAVVMGLSGTSRAGETLELELLLLPLRHRGRTQARALGTLTPLGLPHWIGLRPLVRLETRSLRVLSMGRRDADLLPPPPAANDPVPVRRRHLLVHTGGRS